MNVKFQIFRRNLSFEFAEIKSSVPLGTDEHTISKLEITQLHHPIPIHDDNCTLPDSFDNILIK